MDVYRTVVVGTDGSASSMRAVERAGEVAARQENAKLIIASAHVPAVEKGGWSRAPSHDHVSDPRAADERAIEGAPVHALVKLVKDVNADLLVVGDVGLDTAAGRLLGSVPAEVARRARIDILIVHTAD